MKSIAAISLTLALALALVAGCGPSRTPPPAPLPMPNAERSAPGPTVATAEHPRNEPKFGSAVAVAPEDKVVARVGSRTITMGQLQGPLVQAYGLNLLLNLVQLELAKDTAAKQEPPVLVSPSDIETERELTMSQMFKEGAKEDYPQLLEQLLQNQHISRVEFDLVVETNAYLRKIAEPLINKAITEDKLQEAFRTQYGETVQVRHIQLANATEVAEAKRRLAAGEAFDKVARDMSRNPHTKGLGGELPPFSRASLAYPDVFKDVAFGLKNPGDVSDPVQVESAYHLIKLENRFAPKAVKYEDVKDALRQDLNKNLVQASIKGMREQMATQARQALQIVDPTLKVQYEARIAQAEGRVKDNEAARKEMERERQRLARDEAAQPATQPSTGAIPAGATTAPATPVPAPPNAAPSNPAPMAEGLRPPATKSGPSPDPAPSATPSASPTTNPTAGPRP